jgi:hypothetical protein
MATHLICDKYATHKNQEVRQVAGQSSSVPRHFTLTSLSWLNLVGHWSRKLSR